MEKIKIQSALNALKSRPLFLGSTGERARVRSGPGVVQGSRDLSESLQPEAGLRATSPQWQAEFLESKRVEFLLEISAAWARSPGQGPHPGGGDAPWGR